MASLDELVTGLRYELLRGSTTCSLSGITSDSRKVRHGWAFVAIPGSKVDGHTFIAQALAQGAAALVVERALDLTAAKSATCLRVPDTRQALAHLAAAFYGHPSRQLRLIGVTGTNGKTTCAMLLDAVFAAAGRRTGLIGTVATRIDGHEVAGVRTTPEATDLQRLFRRMLTAGVDSVAMEVSSHGLALGRVNGTRFAAALFTNLTHDHLDFHGSMEAYFDAKALLFTPEFSRVGVINIDDPWGARLAKQATVPVITVSPAGRADADVAAVRSTSDAAGSHVAVRLRSTTYDVDVDMLGAFNVANALLVLAAADVLGLDPATVASTLRHPPAVPGRMERVDEGQSYTVLVDYAHSPDALARVLAATRELVTGRVIVVIGCGGDRDREKRPAMGAAAVAGADHAIFTNDNPRSEDPDVILAAVVAGARSATGGDWTIEPDRHAAIAAALAAAQPGDAVVIAGKGHETGQQLADRTVPFDDREVARALLRGRASE